MRWRTFIAALGSAVAWRAMACAQRQQQMRMLAVLVGGVTRGQ